MTDQLPASAVGDGETQAPPWLSVVMPTFNGARFIRRALDSVVAANEPGLECVVVDDGSTDGTREIVQSYDSVLRLRIEAGAGAGNWVASTNTGVKVATGEYVTFLHQDDEWLPGRIDAVRNGVRQASHSALYVHAAKFVSGTSRDLGDWTLPLPGRTGVINGPLFVERLLVQNFLCIGAPVFCRDQFLAAGGMDENLWYTADWDLWLRLSSTGTVFYDSRRLVGFRIHPASQTSIRSVDLPAFRRQLEEVFEANFSAWSTGEGDLAQVVERAGRASIELNVALAAVSHKSFPPLRPLLDAVVGLGLRGALRVARDSRLHQRVGARIRAVARRDDRLPHLPSRSCR